MDCVKQYRQHFLETSCIVQININCVCVLFLRKISTARSHLIIRISSAQTLVQTLMHNHAENKNPKRTYAELQLDRNEILIDLRGL